MPAQNPAPQRRTPNLPPRISNKPTLFDPDVWQQNVGDDPARYLVDPGRIDSINQISAGQLYNPRPYISNGTLIFDFPIGVEGFRRSGEAQLGLRHYIGDNTVDGVVMHREEGRIELSGTFPGITAQNNMVECINMLRSISPDPGLVLHAPGVFDREVYVLPESWDFTHAEDDRTHSIAYTITFVRIGDSRRQKDPKGKPAPPNPKTKKVPKGKPHKIFTVKDGYRTFRAIAKKVYGDSAKWADLATINRPEFATWLSPAVRKEFMKLPTHKLPTHRWPIGTKLRY